MHVQLAVEARSDKTIKKVHADMLEKEAEEVELSFERKKVQEKRLDKCQSRAADELSDGLDVS
jgi:hypothetical protein